MVSGRGRTKDQNTLWEYQKEDHVENQIPNDLPHSAPIVNDPEKNLDSSLETPSKEHTGRSKWIGSDHDVSKQVNSIEGAKKSQSHSRERQHGQGLTEGDAEMAALPKNNMWLVIPALSLLLFVACLDMTIVVTALPTMAEDLHLTPAGYQWVGTAYLLGTAAFTPFYGRVSDITGRKPMLYGCTIIFIGFSAMCGAAKDMNTMIIGRALQGAGGGAIIVVCMVIIADITPLATRTIWTGLMNSSITIANIVGPIIGGALSEKVSWRWCFYINLPTCAIGLICVGLCVNLNPTKKTGLKELAKTFDFLGLFLIVSGVALTVCGFALAANAGFDSVSSYTLIIVGVLLFVAAIINFIYTKRVPVIPPRIFKIRTTALFLIASLFSGLAFLSTMFLLPQLFQAVKGSTPLQAGIDIIPFCVIVSFVMATTGWFIARWPRIIRPMAWSGYIIAAIGNLLWFFFYTSKASYATLLGLQIITGLGLGLSIQPQLIAMQAAMPLKEVGAVTSAYMLARPIGATIGIAVDQAVLNSGIRSRFERIEGYGVLFEAPTNEAGYQALHNLPESGMKEAILAAFADSLKMCWIIHIAVLIAALLLAIPTREYSLDRQQGVAAPSSAPSSIPESPTSIIKPLDSPNLQRTGKEEEDAHVPTLNSTQSSARAPIVRQNSRASVVGQGLTRVASVVGQAPMGPLGTGAAAAVVDQHSRQ